MDTHLLLCPSMRDEHIYWVDLSEQICLQLGKWHVGWTHWSSLPGGQTSVGVESPVCLSSLFHLSSGIMKSLFYWHSGFSSLPVFVFICCIWSAEYLRGSLQEEEESFRNICRQKQYMCQSSQGEREWKRGSKRLGKVELLDTGFILVFCPDLM